MALQVYVYTPQGYDQGRELLPVLHLLHGVLVSYQFGSQRPYQENLSPHRGGYYPGTRRSFGLGRDTRLVRYQ